MLAYSLPPAGGSISMSSVPFDLRIVEMIASIIGTVAPLSWFPCISLAPIRLSQDYMVVVVALGAVTSNQYSLESLAVRMTSYHCLDLYEGGGRANRACISSQLVHQFTHFNPVPILPLTLKSENFRSRPGPTGIALRQTSPSFHRRFGGGWHFPGRRR